MCLNPSMQLCIDRTLGNTATMAIHRISSSLESQIKNLDRPHMEVSPMSALDFVYDVCACTRMMTHLSISAHDHLLSSEHDVGGPLQAECKKTKKKNSVKQILPSSPPPLCIFAELSDGKSLRTRPGWTLCSSTSCRTSAWSPSH